MTRSHRPVRREAVAVLRGVGMFFNNPEFLRALTEVSLEIRPGEIFGLLGPKDSGKSTLLRILAGRLVPTEGKVMLWGRSPRWPAVRARIGYLPEKASHDRPFGFAGLLSFFAGLMTPASAGPGPEGEESKQSELRKHNLARVIRASRDLVLLDDPFSNLDPAGRRELKEWILALAERGKTVVFSSRSLAEARDVCSRVAIFHEGKIQALGTLGELLATAEAMRFIGPVVPRATAERLMQIIREDLSAETAVPASAAAGSENAGRAAAPETGPNQTPPATTLADQMLGALTKAPAPVAPLEPAPAAPDPINQAKLAEVSHRAARPSRPHEAPPESSADAARAEQKLAALLRPPK